MLLGAGSRRGRRAPRRPTRRPADGSCPALDLERRHGHGRLDHLPHPELLPGFFAPAWLPPGGHGNGLHAPAWAPIADLAPALADRVLTVLAEHGVPGYAAARPGRPRSRTRCWRLWVATGSYTRAEDVLIANLPRLLHETGAR